MANIELRAVNKNYLDNIAVIRNVDLHVKQGEFCVFVGPSGCGKSTLLRMLAGLEDITSGDLLIDDQRMNDTQPAKRGVAMVFQNYALFPHITVFDNLAFGMQLAKMDKALIREKVHAVAKVLQLETLFDRKPKALSGGQRQRVAIGRAIVREPGVFLFDEPLSNLDASLRVQTRFEIAKIHRDFGRAATIYVTHDQVEAMTLADRILLLNAGPAVLSEGSVAQCGSPLALYHRPRNLFVAGFIGSPKMNFMAGTLVEGRVDMARVRLPGGEVLEALVGRQQPDARPTRDSWNQARAHPARHRHARRCARGAMARASGRIDFPIFRPQRGQRSHGDQSARPCACRCRSAGGCLATCNCNALV
jgi:multiple sugar transport system ATP-binding protein